ncbi:hypothetical protein [Rhodoblastus sp.]|jgi:hypothetical protein|uniref:hypothetical protein n=1 Tax=Rhodoblastus sp. TaxID=1962975 RepID=UPI0025FBD50D|nr:hypothetical protein [Rhodoblastus sp.]
MTTTYNLRASNNSTFRWTRDLSQWAAVYNVDAATIRMQARASPLASSPVVYEWCSNNSTGGQIAFNIEPNICTFLAPLSDMLRMSKPLYYDCRLEFENGAAVVVFAGRISWTAGLTRASADGAAIGTSGIGDTVRVDGETSSQPVTLPLSLTAAVAAAQAAAASVTASSLAAQIAALPIAEREALFQSLIASAKVYSGSGPAPVPTGEAFINDSNYMVVAE